MSHRIEVNAHQNFTPLVEFLREHWKHSHVFVRRPDVLQWQHLNVEAGSFNFVTAMESETNQIHAVMGYIPMSHFDIALSSREVFLAIWKVAESCQAVGLGLALLRYYLKSIEPEFIGAIGLSKQVIPIYKEVLRFSVGKMSHFVIFNPRIEELRIASISGSLPKTALLDTPGVELRRLVESDISGLPVETIDLLFSDFQPRKSPTFLINRYLAHPWYNYECFGIMRDDFLSGIVVLRRVSVRNRGVAYRVVDFCGPEEALANAASALSHFCAERGAEYIDVVCFGMTSELLERSGFLLRTSIPDLIVPNYFEPFEQKNVDLDFAFKAISSGCVRLFRGDADQDRPNFVGEE